ncbi:MAG TPA: hypothetical protein PJ994_11705 [Tepidiformaceae bacterium]|nr:hypothetical protein [Tepidiformaceae bacterium]
MSGNSEQDTMDRFAGEPLAGFLQKPFELAVLRTTLQSFRAQPS